MACLRVSSSNMLRRRFFMTLSPSARILRSIDSLVKKEVTVRAEEILAKSGNPPALSVILVGDRKDSAAYVRSKKKSCEEAGIRSVGYHLSGDTTQREILDIIKKLNQDPLINGILVQLPLPSHINQDTIIASIDPLKDVDGLHQINQGDLFKRGMEANLIPCTPLGVMRLLEYGGVSIAGQKAVVLGRSHLVGKPAAILLMSRDATVTVVHSKTQKLPEVVREADIVVAAIGKPLFVKREWIKPGATVIDVGINAISDPSKKSGHRLVGDVDFDEAQKVAGIITPVPGGVGLMTVAMLLHNTIKAWGLQHNT